MTPSQQRLLLLIRDEIAKTGICPSYSEMMRAMGFASKGNIARIINILIRDGHLIRGNGGTHRTLRLASVDISQVSTADLLEELSRRIKRHGIISSAPEPDTSAADSLKEHS